MTRVARRLAAWAAVVAALGLCSAMSAGAAVGIDQAFRPNLAGCGGTFLVTGAPPGITVSAPFSGVITSWSHETNANAPQIKLKAMRPAGGANYTTIGESAVETTTPNTVHTFATRIPVQAGDIIGFTLVTNGSCLRMAAGWVGRNSGADPPVGSTTTFGAPLNGTQYEISALLEPDADNDGFGDETQDNCPQVANPEQADADGDGIGAACEDEVPPSASITSGPKDSTKKKHATFEFSGTDVRAVASFECSVDGGPFATCSSPHAVTVKKGQHTFAVRTVDQAGNTGAPADDDWRVKKKHKK